MIIQYYADSLGMPRPEVVQPGERYIHRLEKWLRTVAADDVFLFDRSRPAQTIDQLFEVFTEDERYVMGRKDILILHEGVCDCAPRPIPNLARAMISRLPSFLRGWIVAFLHRHRAHLLSLGFRHVRVPVGPFEQTLDRWLTIAAERFDRVYVLTIAPTNPEIELHSPGFSENIVAYNRVIQDVISRLARPSIQLIDVFGLISDQTDRDAYIVKEDGHHLTARAHELIAAQLISAERRRLGHAP